MHTSAEYMQERQLVPAEVEPGSTTGSTWGNSFAVSAQIAVLDCHTKQCRPA